MDIKQLRAVSAVGAHRSFSGAARALSTVQSNISAHVARLERELGVTLIERETNELTPEGQVVAARTQRIETELEALASDLAALRDEVVGQVRVGMIGTTARWLVPLLLDHLSVAHPGIHVTLLDGTTSVLLPRVVEGDLDLAVVSESSHDPAVSMVSLFDEDLVLVVGVDHPLAGRSRVSVVDLDGWEVILDVPGSRFRALLDSRCAAAGVELLPKAEIEGLRLIASLAFSGFGAAVLPALFIAGAEWGNALAGLSTADRAHNAWFQSVTLRTAGFNSIDLAALNPATVLMMPAGVILRVRLLPWSAM